MNPDLWPAGNAPVLHTIAPGPVGGAESAVLGLTAGLGEIGVPTVLAVLADATSAPFIERARAEGRAVEVVESPGRNYPRDWSGLRRIIRKHRAILVHTHGYRADMMGHLAARAERLPVVATAHGFTGGSRKNRFNQWLAMHALKRDDAVIAVSQPLADDLAGRGVPSARIEVIPNAWRPPPTAPLDRGAARQALGLGGSGPFVGWVGRLSHVKGADLAIEALAQLPSKDVTLVFVGDGPERAALGSLAASLGVGDRVHFAGMVAGASTVLAAFDLLVLSSRSEGTPMILLEAMHSRLPIVAAAVGGIPDLLRPMDAVLVPGNDVSALTAGIAAALADPVAAAGRADLAARRVQANFSAGAWVDRHRAVYQRVMEQRH